MPKLTITYICNACGAKSPKWAGQCASCEAWNTVIEQVSAPQAQNAHPALRGFAKLQASQVTKLSEVEVTSYMRFSTQSLEFDRVLGGGIVAGSVVLIGGDPGIGKSTLLLQALCQLSQQKNCLYVTGEESLQQVMLRAHRLNLQKENLNLLAQTCVEDIVEAAQKVNPQVMVIDSVQTIYTQLIPSAPGGVAQVRESAAQLVQYAKQSGVALFLVGHVTKEGALAGPRVLEHMVDTVLYFEGEKSSRFRMLRAVKNRFGAVNELGVFAMTEKGLQQVSNPSAIFLSNYKTGVPGSTITVAWEGSRPILAEVQALVSDSYLGNPRRVTVGLDQNRLSMLLAVLQRHGGITTHDQDVFINIVGGMKILETSVDLALLLAVYSSLKNRLLFQELIVFGEVGLAGEIRPVQNGEDRIKEAEKHGFKRAIVPKANKVRKNLLAGIEVIEVETLSDVLELF